MLALGGMAYAATQSSTIRITLRKPVTIALLRDLDFGRLASGTTASTLVIDPTSDARSTIGGVLAAGGTPLAAQFYIYATGNQTPQVTLGPLPAFNRARGVGWMNVTQLTLNGPVLGVLGAAGLLDLRVVGALPVAANQPDGVYSGNFDITVTYF